MYVQCCCFNWGRNQLFNILCLTRPPSTPERSRTDERAQEHLNRQMTSPTDRHAQAAIASASRMVHPSPPPPSPLPQPLQGHRVVNDPFYEPPQPPEPTPRTAVANICAALPPLPQPLRRRQGVQVPAPLPNFAVGREGVAQMRAIRDQIPGYVLQPPVNNQQQLPLAPILPPPVQHMPHPLPAPQPAPVIRQQQPLIGCELHLARQTIIEDNISLHSLGRMNKECPHCHALHWDAEKQLDSTANHLKFGTCCQVGKVVLPLLNEAPQPLQDLLSGHDRRSSLFFKMIRRYNAALAFASMGCKTVPMPGTGPSVFKILGGVCHRMSNLIPGEGIAPQYAQLWLWDSAEALRLRLNANDIVDDHQLMSDLQEMLRACNPFVDIYRQATERLRNEENRMQLQNPGYNWRTDGDIRAVVTYRDHTDSRRYNISSADEIAVILPDIQLEPGAVMLHRDIVIQLLQLMLHFTMFFYFHRESLVGIGIFHSLFQRRIAELLMM